MASPARIRSMIIALVAVVLAVTAAGPAVAATPEAQLAERYAPIMMLREQPQACDSTGEAFVPMPVDAVLDSPQVTLRRLPAGSTPERDLGAAPGAAGVAELGPSYELDFPGDPLNAGCRYEQDSRALMTGRVPTTYAHIATERGVPGLAVQYWFFWYYNDWNNKHEGDWEMIQVAFDADTVEEALAEEPARVAYAQHEGGQVRDWTDPTVLREGTRPVVFPGEGSHASYYGRNLYLGTGQGGAGLGCDDTRDASNRVPLTPVVVPTDPAAGTPAAWLTYRGHWGEELGGFNGAPDGPWNKGQWREPMRWMGGLKADAVAVPGGGSLGPSTSGVFCTAVATGSKLVNAASESPWLILALLLAIILGIRLVYHRTVWHPAPPEPVDQRRRAGQALVAARRLWRRNLPVMALLGLAFVILGALSTVFMLLVLSLPGMSALVDAAERPDAVIGLVQLVGGVGGSTVAFALASAAVVAAVCELADGRPLRAGSAYRLVLARVGSVIWTGLLSLVVIVLLCITIVGIPWAVKKAVDWIFSTHETVRGGHSGVAALRASTDLVRGRWWSTFVYALTVTGVGLMTGPLVGIVLIYLTQIPAGTINLITSLVYMVSVPYMITATTLLWFDRRRAPQPVAAPATSPDRALGGGTAG